MRDPSEVIAATLTQCKRKIEAYQAAYGLGYVGGQEASSLLRDIDVALATLPASTPPGDGVAHLNAALGHAFTDDPANACRAHAAVLPILQQLSTPQPASDEPCVRHACKRVRMEMQARIDALSQPAAAEVDAAIGRIVWKYIDRMNDVCESDTADTILAEFTAAVCPLMLAAIKGDSHAG